MTDETPKKDPQSAKDPTAKDARSTVSDLKIVKSAKATIHDVKDAIAKDARETIHDLNVMDNAIRKHADRNPIMWAIIFGLLFAAIFIACLIFQGRAVDTM